MTRILRPSDRLMIPNLLTRLPTKGGRVIYSPPNPGIPFASLPFSVPINEIGQIVLDFQPAGIVVTNPYPYYIYFPGPGSWSPQFYANYIIPYAPYPGAIIQWDSTKDPYGNPQQAGSQVSGAASCIATNDLTQFSGGGALGVNSAAPYRDTQVLSCVGGNDWIATGWAANLPIPNNHAIVQSGGTVNLYLAAGTSPTELSIIAVIGEGANVDLAPIRFPPTWDIYAAWASTESATISIVAY